MHLHPRGFGFVEITEKNASFSEVFIPKRYILDAIGGDIVKVQILSFKSKKGPEGKIIQIIQRKRDHLAGIICYIEESIAHVFCPNLGLEKLVTLINLNKKNTLLGERVLVKVHRWKGEDNQIEAELVESIGHITNAKDDVFCALYEFEIQNEFPEKIHKSLEEFSTKVLKKDLENREDLTQLNTISIDPATAKDLDDALSIEKDEKGNLFLGVHIADVSHYVKDQSDLDKYAFERSNSTYFPGKCIPMLPEKLSNGLCSLNSDVIRLTITVLIQFDPSGELINYRIFKSFIENKKQFSYEEVSEILENKKTSSYSSTLSDLKDLALLLKNKKKQRGSIDFAFDEIIVNVDDAGEPTHISKSVYDISHQMVEEFMLKANEVVAIDLKKRKKELIFRVHEEPLKESFQDFLSLAKIYGFKVPLNPSFKQIQKILIEAKDTSSFRRLSTAYIKSLKLACYSPENLGHFGLSLKDYCHFTSPIRRYSDLIVHRILFDEITISKTILKKISDHLSTNERKSMKAEMSVIYLKKLRLLEQSLRKDPKKVYPATIVRIKPYYIFFELDEFFIEGSLHISDLNWDYFIFSPQKNEMRGKRTNKKYQIGSKLSLAIQKIDLTKFLIKWTNVS